MNYKTKSWKVECFQYDPYDYKPDWFMKMIEEGRAFEYQETEGQKAHVSFGDKRSQHKALIGDWVVRDEFGRYDVWSARHFKSRAQGN